MSDDSDITAARLGQIMGLTERQVKDRVAKGIFICHWRGGTEEHPRSMRFTPEDVAHNRSIGASRTLTPPASPAHSDTQIRKGVARLRKTQQAVSS